MMENVREEYFLFLQFLNLSFVPGLAQQTVTPVPSSRLPSSAENITIHSWEHKTRWRPLFTTKTTIQAQLGTQNKMAAIIHYKDDNFDTSRWRPLFITKTTFQAKLGQTNKMVTNIHYKDDNLDTDEANKMAASIQYIDDNLDTDGANKMVAIIHYKDDNLGTTGITNKMAAIIHKKTTM